MSNGTFPVGPAVLAAAACVGALVVARSSAKQSPPASASVEVTSAGIDMCFGNTRRKLPKREVKPGVVVALFNCLGDWELNEALGTCLLPRIPAGTEYLLMPDGKAQSILHVLGRLSGLPTLVAKKEVKPYMLQPVVKGVREQCMTSNAKEEAFYLGADHAAKLQGRRVLIVDDVVSTGGSVKAIRSLMSQAGAIEAGVMCALTEGGLRDDVICLGNLPVNAPEW